MTERVKVFLVDDHGIVRSGLKLLLELDKRIEVCGEAKNLQETMDALAECKPDVVLLDFKRPDGDGVNGCLAIKNRLPQTKIIILTAYSQPHLVMEAIRAGADGYLLKNVKGEELVDNILKVYHGDSVLDSAVTESILTNIISSNERQKEDKLTNKEMEILKMISIGKSNKEIAKDMEISEKTVRNYISNIFRKLNVSNRTEAASYWLRKQTLE
mgnify:CR=1 FL=1